MSNLSELWRDWRIARCLGARCKKREGRIIRRKADGSLWVAGHPQNFAYAMQGMFTGKAGFHFWRAREWFGLLIASPKVFWRPESGEFDLLYSLTYFVLPPWAESEECRRINAASVDTLPEGRDTK